MANATALTAAETVTAKVAQACGGDGCGIPGASFKAFTLTCGTGNFPLAGLTVDLSGIFPNKVIAAVVGPLHDPAATTGDKAVLAVYIPDSAGDPTAGKLVCYMDSDAALSSIVTDDTFATTGYVCHGIGIGY